MFTGGLETSGNRIYSQPRPWSRGTGHKVSRSAVPAVPAALSSPSTWPLVVQTDFRPLSKGSEWMARVSLCQTPCQVQLWLHSCYVLTSLKPHSNPLKYFFLSFILQVRLNYSARSFNYKLAERQMLAGLRTDIQESAGVLTGEKHHLCSSVQYLLVMS